MNTYTKTNIITAGTVLNATRTSPAMQVINMWGFAIQVVFTGTPTGTFKLQASADPLLVNNPIAYPPPTNWTDIADSSHAVVAAGDYMWDVFDVTFNFVRLVYTDTSGGASTAVLTVSTFNGKGV